jgi:hypothetical protein
MVNELDFPLIPTSQSLCSAPQIHWIVLFDRVMPTSTQAVLSQITGITFDGGDDPRIQMHAKDLCDAFHLDALRFEAALEARLLEEVGKCIKRLCHTLVIIIVFFQQNESVSNTVHLWSRSIIITVFWP